MLDLISTILQPVVVIYLGYIVYLLASHSDVVPITSLLLLAAIYGLQAVIFILRRKWEMVGYLMIYILAIPVYSFALPLHAFWNMDKFSWYVKFESILTAGVPPVSLKEKEVKPSSSPTKVDLIPAPFRNVNGTNINLKTWAITTSQEAEVSSGSGRQSVRTSMFVPTVDQRGRFSRAIDQQNFYDNPPRTADNRSPGRSPLGRESFVGGDPYITLPAHLGGEVLEMQEAPIHPSQRLSRPFSSTTSLDPSKLFAGTVPGLPSDEQLLAEIKRMLENADLMSVTKKDVKLHLERVFGVPLDVRREYINQCTEAVLSGRL